jgi:gliding motility-associated-like protein
LYRHASLLDATFSGANYYEWQDSSGNPQFLVDSSGLYYVSIGAANCMGSDTIAIDYVEPIQLDLGNDTALCPQVTMVLNSFATSAQFYLWQDGSTSSSFIIQTPGTYHVTITDSNGCKVSDTIFVDAIIPIQVVLGEDTVVCAGTSLMLDATTSDALSYLWSTNETTASIEVSDTLAYWVTVTNSCGTSSDTFALKFIDCELDVFVPNAFTPNQDGLNDDFRPITSNISSFQMSLFNRWGQLIFFTTDPNMGWDGKVKEVEQEIGVYYT